MREGYYKDKYRIKSTRLEKWDYSNAGFYFITVCSRNLECNLGRIIKSGDMGKKPCSVCVELSVIGEMVEEEWLKSGNKRREISLHEYVVMPNHFHGIIEILKNDSSSFFENNPLGSQKNSLSNIINHFKGSVTRRCNELKYNFTWQARFYDRLMLGAEEIKMAKQYIKNNPKNWETDRNNEKYLQN